MDPISVLIGFIIGSFVGTLIGAIGVTLKMVKDGVDLSPFTFSNQKKDAIERKKKKRNKR